MNLDDLSLLSLFVGVPMLFVIGGNPWARPRRRPLEFKKRK